MINPPPPCIIVLPPPPPWPNKLCVSVRSLMSAGIVGLFVNSVYEPVNAVPPIESVCVCTLVAFNKDEFVRSRLSPTGNSFILLPSVVSTTNGILFAIFAPYFTIFNHYTPPWDILCPSTV